MPYAFLIIDILSWWLTKLSPMFASLIMVAGGGMGASFAFMWVVSMKEMWFINNPWFCEPGSPCQRALKIISGFSMNSLAYIGRKLRVEFFPKLFSLLEGSFNWLYNKMK